MRRSGALTGRADGLGGRAPAVLRGAAVPRVPRRAAAHGEREGPQVRPARARRVRHRLGPGEGWRSETPLTGRAGREITHEDVRERRDVLSQRPLRLVRVARTTRGDDGAVTTLFDLVDALLVVTDHERAEALRRFEHGPQQPRDPARPGGLGEGEVEVRVSADDLGALAATVGEGQPLERGVEQGRRLLAPAERRAPHPRRLEREPCLVDVPHLGRVDRRHARPPVRGVLGEAECRELPDGLPDRGDAHPETVGDLFEAERRPGRDLPDDDQLSQRLGRTRGHRAPVRRAERGVCGE